MRSAICLNYGHSRITLHCGFSHGLKLSFMARLHLGFISITRYRDIDRGVGDLVTIAAPRHRTISPTKASLASALLNSSHRTHSVIIIGRTVTGHHNRYEPYVPHMHMMKKVCQDQFTVCFFTFLINVWWPIILWLNLRFYLNSEVVGAWFPQTYKTWNSQGNL